MFGAAPGKTTNLMDVEVGVVYLQRVNNKSVMFPIEAGPNAKCNEFGYSADIKIKYGAKNVYKRASTEQISAIVSEYGPVKEWSCPLEQPKEDDNDDEEEEEDDASVVMQFSEITSQKA